MECYTLTPAGIPGHGVDDDTLLVRLEREACLAGDVLVVDLVAGRATSAAAVVAVPSGEGGGAWLGNCGTESGKGEAGENGEGELHLEKLGGLLCYWEECA